MTSVGDKDSDADFKASANRQPYDLGLPVWACEAWRGTLYTQAAKRSDWLTQYSSVFSAVEGNSTFYGLPRPETVQRWGEEARPGFRFCLKFPQEITHERQLVDAESTTAVFLELLAILDDHSCLGSSLLQLPPLFSASQRGDLERYLDHLPPQYPYAVEVRHLSWFDEADNEQWLDDLLRARGIDRVIFDSRALFSRPPADEIEAESQRRKPRSPMRETVTAGRPMVRFVGRNQLEEARPWIDQWGQLIAEWITQGLRPTVFTHSPDDTFAPQFAVALHEQIRIHLPDLPPLPQFAGFRELPPIKQQTLF